MAALKGRETGWKRLGAWSAGGGAIAITAVMVLSAMASATTVVAPYKGVVSTSDSYVSTSGCATAKITSPVNWSATTGVAQMSVKSSAASCKKTAGPIGSSSYGSAEAEVDLGVPVKITTSTTHTIVANWATAAVMTNSLLNGKCTGPVPSTATFFYCDSYAEWYAELYGYFIDLTNGTYYYPSSSGFAYNETYNDTELYSGTWYNSSGSFSYGSFGSGNVSLWINTTALVASHHYLLVMYLYVEAYDDLYSYQASHTGATASTSVTMNGATNRATLTSISVT